MDRHAKTLWMKELLAHLHDCHDRWHTAAGATERYLARSIVRDLGELSRLCQSLRRDALAAPS
ncbi:MAG: hypothetical protein HYX69_22720 [Planctomycetia bacterium]|nr:hypothetical protein [Planctomycetia bacterium]